MEANGLVRPGGCSGDSSIRKSVSSSLGSTSRSRISSNVAGARRQNDSIRSASPVVPSIVNHHSSPAATRGCRRVANRSFCQAGTTHHGRPAASERLTCPNSSSGMKVNGYLASSSRSIPSSPGCVSLLMNCAGDRANQRSPATTDTESPITDHRSPIAPWNPHRSTPDRRLRSADQPRHRDRGRRPLRRRERPYADLSIFGMTCAAIGRARAPLS